MDRRSSGRRTGNGCAESRRYGGSCADSDSASRWRHAYRPFTYRIRQMASTILGDAAYAPFNPPIRCQVITYTTSKGPGYDLVDA